jgi:L-serine deaminase
LRLQALVELVFALLRVVDCGLVAVVEEVASCDEAVAAIVAGAAGYEDAFARVEGLEFEDWETS